MAKLIQKTFTLYYKDGKEQTIKGLTIKDALVNHNLGIKTLGLISHYDER